MAESPNDASLKSAQIVFGDLAVSDLLRQADGESQGNISGRAALVTRAQTYVSSRSGEIEKLLHDFSVKKAELTDLLNVQLAKPSLNDVFAGLESHTLYFKDDAELKAAFVQGLGSRIAEESIRVAVSGDFQTLDKVRAYLTEFGLNDSIKNEFRIAVNTGLRALLREKITGVIKGEDRGERAIWGTLLGETGEKLRLAVFFQGTLDQNFIEALRNRIGTLLSGEFNLSFISNPSEWKHGSDLLAVVELKDSGTKTEEKSEKKFSKYFAGTRQDANPNYIRAQNAYAAAKANDDRAWQLYQAQRIQYQNALAQSQAQAQAALNNRQIIAPVFIPTPMEPNQIASQFALGALQATPPTIDTPIYQTYEYVQKITQATYFGEVMIHITLRADELVSVEYPVTDKSNSEWYEHLGVHPNDSTTGPGNFSPDAIQTKAAAFMESLAEATAEKTSVGLKDLSLQVMSSAVDRHIGQRFALGAAIACAATKPLDAEEASFLAQAYDPKSVGQWRAAAVLAALKRANVSPERVPVDLAVQLAAPYQLTDAGAPMRGARAKSPAATAAGNVPTAITPALEHLLDAVVTVLTNDKSGTGFFVSAKGTILTNYHVIEGAREIYVRLRDGQRLSAVVVDKNVNRDLAVLQVNEAKFSVAALGDPETIAVGTEVYAVGSPGGVASILDYSVTRGIVSAHRRFASETNAAVEIELLQTDAAINPGNSGGPLATFDGRVVGINTWKVAGNSVQGLNFAVSINEARKYFYRYMD